MSHTVTHKALEEIAAPASIEDVGVDAGDRGVIVEVFERPGPAVMVEFANDEGETKALVTYSYDLEETLEVMPEPA